MRKGQKVKLTDSAGMLCLLLSSLTADVKSFCTNHWSRHDRMKEDLLKSQPVQNSLSIPPLLFARRDRLLILASSVPSSSLSLLACLLYDYLIFFTQEEDDSEKAG